MLVLYALLEYFVILVLLVFLIISPLFLSYKNITYSVVWHCKTAYEIQVLFFIVFLSLLFERRLWKTSRVYLIVVPQVRQCRRGPQGSNTQVAGSCIWAINLNIRDVYSDKMIARWPPGNWDSIWIDDQTIFLIVSQSIEVNCPVNQLHRHMCKKTSDGLCF